MDTPFTPISEDEVFSFECSSKQSCFNACCRDLNQYLSPYDILRLKTHMEISSGEFLSRFTNSYIGERSGLPVVVLKTDPSNGFQCPFVRKEGCSVYDNRPGSCRLYPLARVLARSKETGQKKERFFLIKESHCRGIGNGRKWSVQQWLDDQAIYPFNLINDMMIEIIHQKNLASPGPLDPKSAKLFYQSCYDIDTFKILVFEKEILKTSSQHQDLLNRAWTDQKELLILGLHWIKNTLFPS